MDLQARDVDIDQLFGTTTYSTKESTNWGKTLYWNETLREDSYKSKLDFTRWIADNNLDFKPYDVFGPKQLEERHQLLFRLIGEIWK